MNNFIQEMSDAFNKAFYLCAETFLRNYGCLPDNAHEFSMEHSVGGWTAYILRNGKRIGRIEVFTTFNETGISFRTVAEPWEGGIGA